MFAIELPWPPSLNRYWRHVGPRVLISRDGRAFRERVLRQLAGTRVPAFVGPLEVAIDLIPPDRRRFDCDNFAKATLDALQHAGVYANDSQIVHLDLWKRPPFPGGCTRVRITEVPCSS